jgi:hypothetical protein
MVQRFLSRNGVAIDGVGCDGGGAIAAKPDGAGSAGARRCMGGAASAGRPVSCVLCTSAMLAGTTHAYAAPGRACKTAKSTSVTGVPCWIPGCSKKTAREQLPLIAPVGSCMQVENRGHAASKAAISRFAGTHVQELAADGLVGCTCLKHHKGIPLGGCMDFMNHHKHLACTLDLFAFD